VQLCNEIDALVDQVSKPHPRDMREICDLVISKMPKFVYYSTYGNLDSEIYLPHVIANLKRTDLELKEQSKARTLKVLFEFVRLKEQAKAKPIKVHYEVIRISPTEIHELHDYFKDPTRSPTEAEIADIAEKKKQRSILMQTASTPLTKEIHT